MLQLFIRLSLIFLVAHHLITPCSAWSFNRGRGYKTTKNTKIYTSTSTSLPPQPTPRRGLGISAWGIITLIVSMILAIVGLYYVSICYPAVCRKNTKYNLMASPTLA